MTTTAPRTTPTGRLGHGELRRQVAALPGEPPRRRRRPARSPGPWASPPARSATP